MVPIDNPSSNTQQYGEGLTLDSRQAWQSGSCQLQVDQLGQMSGSLKVQDEIAASPCIDSQVVVQPSVLNSYDVVQAPILQTQKKEVQQQENYDLVNEILNGSGSLADNDEQKNVGSSMVTLEITTKEDQQKMSDIDLLMMDNGEDLFLNQIV
eukprot:TRINITY_DN56252_c0_g1_i2.p4 TRINITY_DN56252_c0_g1~~TRINITY_DN56252_c0_g1_i2.p4  ORF type:complete len:153 (-),score=29.93 TRINITY_DN56252_c0_g1_i2:376-834(-)